MIFHYTTTASKNSVSSHSEGLLEACIPNLQLICKQKAISSPDFQLHSRDKDKFLSSSTLSVLLAAGWSWRGMWHRREIVFGPDTFREGQTVTLCQPGRTQGTSMLNTISWSANGREFVVAFGGMCLFACFEMVVWLCLCISMPCAALCINTHTIRAHASRH